MLHNILLTAGKFTEIAKQGKFINVVLAAGEITARIRKDSGEVFETLLVSGMAFPVVEGFVSVAFLSDVTQQTKIWLGAIPLTYSPIESKNVGSSALSSAVYPCYFGGATELIPAKSGRGKITLSATEDFKVGGVNLNAENAITIKANERFEINTQGSIYAYSDNILNRKIAISKNTMLNYSQLISSYGTAFNLEFNADQTRLFSCSYTKILEANVATLTNGSSEKTHSTVAMNTTNHIVVGNSYIVLGVATDSVIIFTVNMNDGSLIETQLTATGIAANSSTWDLDGDNIAVSDSSGAIFTGTLSGGALTNVAQPVPTLKSVIYSNSKLIATNTDSNVYSSVDNGTNWTDNGAKGVSMSGFQIWKNKVNGKLYIQSQNNLDIYESTNAGVTFSQKLSFANTVDSFLAVGNNIYFTAYKSLYMSNDDFNTLLSNNLTTNVSAVSLTIGSIDGHVYVSKQHQLHDWVGEISYSGGLQVAAMAEVN